MKDIKNEYIDAEVGVGNGYGFRGSLCDSHEKVSNTSNVNTLYSFRNLSIPSRNSIFCENRFVL